MEASRLAHKALQEHERLNRDIARLKSLLDDCPPTAQQDWFQRCAATFRQFHADLKHHIEFEELDGFMRPVCERRPTLTPILERLLAQHQEMLEDCTAIEDFCNTHATPTPAECATGRDRMLNLLARLQEHERTENRLIQETFNIEIGAGD